MSQFVQSLNKPSSSQQPVQKLESNINNLTKKFETLGTAPPAQLPLQPINKNLAPLTTTPTTKSTQQVVMHTAPLSLPKGATPVKMIPDSQKSIAELQSEIIALNAKLKLTDPNFKEEVKKILGKLKIILEKISESGATPELLKKYTILIKFYNVLLKDDIVYLLSQKRIAIAVAKKYSLPIPESFVYSQDQSTRLKDDILTWLQIPSFDGLLASAHEFETTVVGEATNRIVTELVQSSTIAKAELPKLLEHIQAMTPYLSQISEQCKEELDKFYKMYDTEEMPNFSEKAKVVLHDNVNAAIQLAVNTLISNDALSKCSKKSLSREIKSIAERAIIDIASEKNKKTIQFLVQHYPHIVHVYNQGKDENLEGRMAGHSISFEGICEKSTWTDCSKLLNNPTMDSSEFFKLSALALYTQKVENTQFERNQATEAFLKEQRNQFLTTLGMEAGPDYITMSKEMLTEYRKGLTAFSKIPNKHTLLKSTLLQAHAAHNTQGVYDLYLSTPTHAVGHAMGIQLDAKNKVYRFFDNNACVASYRTAQECVDGLEEYLNAFYENWGVEKFTSFKKLK